MSPARGLDKGVEKQDSRDGRRPTTALGALVTAIHRGATFMAATMIDQTSACCGG